jgi:DNA polymerase-3 subunit epsilon
MGEHKQKESPTFVAIDFETSDNWRDSACEVGLVRVESGRIVERRRELIRPPRRRFSQTRVHGLTWDDVRDAPPFPEVWPMIRPLLKGAEFLNAHTAFDRSVLHKCCHAGRLVIPAAPFLDTMKLARQRWGIRLTKLNDVCQYLRLPLEHHDPLSDAEACAGIVLRAGRRAIRLALA